MECLARFFALPYRTPNLWFLEATEIELGTELELAAMHMALAAQPSLQEDIYVAADVVVPWQQPSWDSPARQAARSSPKASKRLQNSRLHGR